MRYRGPVDALNGASIIHDQCESFCPCVLGPLRTCRTQEFSERLVARAQQLAVVDCLHPSRDFQKTFIVGYSA